MGYMTPGLIITPLKRVEAAQGAVLHALKASAPGYAGFGEAYFSQVHEGATKNWRRHRETTLNLVVPLGNVRFVAHDGTAFEEHVIGAMNYARLTVPPGVWLAFQGRGPGTSTILSIIEREHDPAESDARDLDAFAYHW